MRRKWCPVLDNGRPHQFVNALDQNLDEGIDYSLNNLQGILLEAAHTERGPDYA